MLPCQSCRAVVRGQTSLPRSGHNVSVDFAFPEDSLGQHSITVAYCLCTGLSDIDAGKRLLLFDSTAQNMLIAFLFYKLIRRKRNQKSRVEQVRDELDSESQGSRACRVSQMDLSRDSSIAFSAETETSDTGIHVSQIQRSQRASKGTERQM